MEKVIINVEGMSCNHCKMSVESALNQTTGVSKAEVNLEAKNVTIEFDTALSNLSDLKEIIEDTGFDVV